MEDLKALAYMKKEFLESPFGKIAAEKINELYGQHHQEAEKFGLEPWQKAYHSERAAGINEVISFFTTDVALLESGYFSEETEESRSKE